MESELIINTKDNQVSIALLEEKRLVELNSEPKNKSFNVGDIYLGKVKKLMPGLNAAFVDIGHEKDAFLHYLDLGPQLQSLIKFTRNTSNGKQTNSSLNNFNLEPDINKNGKIHQVLKPKQWIVVQIAKEPISTKGPRLSSELSIAGRFVVLVPFTDTVSVSQKIKGAEERNRLKRLALSIKPKNFGVIVRTVASGKKVAEIDKDIQDLVKKWNTLHQKIKESKPPSRLLGELDRTSTILRDMLNPNFNNIHINDASLADELKGFIKNIAPDQEKIVKYYKGKKPIFEFYSVDKQIKSLFGKTVNMPGGAYLVIEHTEAMHVVDVNSGGRKVNQNLSQEEQALKVNMNAAKEIARQLRLRDMGGIIIVDFIDMHKNENRKELYNFLKSELKKDRTKTNVLPPSKFGLIQITRQRVRPETNIKTLEKCPTCNGTGEMKASILLIDDIENILTYCIKEQNEKKLTLKTHPYVYAYITKGWFSIKRKWRKKLGQRINIEADNAYHLMEFHLFRNNDEEIKI